MRPGAGADAAHLVAEKDGIVGESTILLEVAESLRAEVRTRGDWSRELRATAEALVSESRIARADRRERRTEPSDA